MPKFDIPDYQKQGLNLQLIPFIDILFFTLILFMSLYVTNQMQEEININVPKSKTAAEATKNAGDIVININQDGRFIVNQEEISRDGLEAMLTKVAALFPDQQVIIRADENTFHKYVVQALDACARANIGNISFLTVKEENR